MKKIYKGIQYHGPRKAYKYRTFEVNGAYLAILTMNGVIGGYSAWGIDRIEAVRNVFSLAGNYIG